MQRLGTAVTRRSSSAGLAKPAESGGSICAVACSGLSPADAFVCCSRLQAEKAERKASKSDEKALKSQSHAESKLHDTAKELERAQAKHDQGE